MAQARVPPHSTRAWLYALGRGAILGVVMALHLALLAWLLRVDQYREAHVPLPPGAGDALRLIFVPIVTPKAVAKAPAAPRRRMPASAPPPQRAEAVSSLPTGNAPAMVDRSPPIPTIGPATPAYQPGDFRTRLGEAQRTRAVPLPGAATARVGGFDLRVARSTQDLVRQLTVGTRCTAMQFDMRKKMATSQLMDRLLEADGCGPHAERTPASGTIEAITRRLLDEP